MLKEPDNPKLLVVCWVVCCACIASIGCQRRAYTDLYAESMAGEIRELEDRIYEYDAAYQAIEEELAILQSDNDRLHNSLSAMRTESSRASNNGKSLFKSSPGPSKSPSFSESYNQRESYPVDPQQSFQIIPKPDPVPNIVPAVPPKSSNDTKTPSVDKLPAPAENNPAKPPKASPKTEPYKLEPPTIELGTPSKSILPPASAPKPSASPMQTPNIEALQPPPINSPLTPMPDHSSAIQALPETVDDDAIDAGRILLPSSVQPAAHQNSISDSTRSTAKDSKVIEIAFHPTLCRGQCLGSGDNNDGMYLVLQPRNASGEPVDTPASLTIVVLDPNRPESESKLGRWTLTKEEVDAQLEPVGLGHGFHIPLKWQEAKPLGDAVQVYVRYEMEDGRRLVNERRLQLHVPTTGSASWTPRVAK